MMLRYIGQPAVADKMERAIAGVVAEGKHVTYDLKNGDGKPAGTSEVASAVIEKYRKQDGKKA
jgi:isocitrate dehydrogenase (NAD+)